MDDEAWINDRIAWTQAAIVAYEAAILALSTGAQSYRLTTGQTDQMVTKAALADILKAKFQLEGSLRDYQALLCSGAAIYGRPGF